MSDFRIVLHPDAEFSDRELDWVEAGHEWRLSDKEYGSVTWEVDRNPTQPDLEALRDFFEVPGDSALDALADLSPGELSAIHARSNEPPRIIARRCEAYGQHWIVYKLSGATWLKYGRKCDAGWWLGHPVSDGEASGTAGN